MSVLFVYIVCIIYFRMKQEMCILPVRCEKCRGVFDLWYDLQEDGETEESYCYGQSDSLGSALKETHCWRCRQAVIGQMKKGVVVVGKIAKKTLLTF